MSSKWLEAVIKLILSNDCNRCEVAVEHGRLEDIQLDGQSVGSRILNAAL